jgi:type I restriction enzyme S subunit
MSAWDIAKINDICCKICSGGTPKSSNKEYYDGDIPWLNTNEVDFNNIYKTNRFITEEGLNNSAAKYIPANSIVVAMYGVTAGKCAITKIPLTTNQACCNLIINEHKADYKYVFYYIRTQSEILNNLATGGAQQNLNSLTIKKFKIPLPSIPIQKRIADILSTYDDLIENNNERIALLEKAAQALYKEWFVRFRFPGHETARFVNGLPEGWTRRKINEFYNTCSGGTPSRSKSEYYENGVYPWVKTGEIRDSIVIDAEEYITENAIRNSSAKLLPAKSVVMAMYAVNIGMLAYFDQEMACNQACCVFSDKRNFPSRHYLFQYLLSIRDYFLLIGFGAAQQNLSQDLIKNVKILMPTDELVMAFEKKVDDCYASIRILMMCNQNLAKQRDLLLPRLMSGKLEV